MRIGIVYALGAGLAVLGAGAWPTGADAIPPTIVEWLAGPSVSLHLGALKGTGFGIPLEALNAAYLYTAPDGIGYYLGPAASTDDSHLILDGVTTAPIGDVTPAVLADGEPVNEVEAANHLESTGKQDAASGTAVPGSDIAMLAALSLGPGQSLGKSGATPSQTETPEARTLVLLSGGLLILVGRWKGLPRLFRGVGRRG